MWPTRRNFRRTRNYLLACASEVAGPVLAAAPLLACQGRKNMPSDWRRGLILGADHIGDVLFNTGSLSALHAGLPQCSWYYATSSAGREVLLGNPNLAGTEERERLAAPRNRSPGYDAVLCYNSGAVWPDQWLAVRMGIPNRAGYTDKGFSALINWPVHIRRPQPYAGYFRDFVAQITGQEPSWPLRPQIFPGTEDVSQAQALWDELGLAGSPAVLACFVTSRQASGVFPAEKYGEVLRQVHAGIDCRSVLLGTRDDEPILARLREQFSLPTAIVPGRLGIRALAAFLGRCTAVLSTDSGPRHLANAVGRPVVYVRNLAVGKVETGTYLESEYDFASDAEYVPIKRQPEEFARVDTDRMARKLIELLAKR